MAGRALVTTTVTYAWTEVPCVGRGSVGVTVREVPRRNGEPREMVGFFQMDGHTDPELWVKNRAFHMEMPLSLFVRVVNSVLTVSAEGRFSQGGKGVLRRRDRNIEYSAPCGETRLFTPETMRELVAILTQEG